MDIKELNKTQLVLLTLLITFVVSIATGIITVSIMQQMPKSVPQTINNVIQRTIEKVTTVQAPVVNTEKDSSKEGVSFGDGDAMISIYAEDAISVQLPGNPSTEEPKPLGQGIIISDVGLILVDSSILTEKEIYKVILSKTDFDATVIKKFSNGFAILKISQKKKVDDTKTGDTNSKIDNKQ